MTHIPGTQSLSGNSKQTKEEAKVIGTYKKESYIEKKIIKNKPKWDSELYFWLKISGVLSLISIILGFLIYKSFFFLAIFIPIAIISVWYFIKFVEDTISKHDVFSK